MATQFPEELDSFLNPQPTDSVAAVSHAAQHSNTNDAIAALQAKVGVDGSPVITSLDYRVATLENASIDTETIQDLVDGVLFEGTGIVKLYDDNLNTITLSVDTNTIATKAYVDTRDIVILEAAYEYAAEAKVYTDLMVAGLSAVYDPLGSASAALSDANEYTDIAVAGLGNSLPNIYVPISDVGALDGVAQLVGGFVPLSQLNITEEIQDVAAQMITSGTHTNISVSYNDENGTISFTGSAPQLTQEEIQDFVAPLLNHALHTNISATYDDVNNRIVLQGNSGGGGGASVIISPTAPSTPGLGDIWLDSDNGKTYIWDGAFWIEVGGSSSQAVAAVTSIPPTSPVLGSIWLNSSTAKTYIYDGSFWVEV